jgi:multidrug efflux system outer membrane protein
MIISRGMSSCVRRDLRRIIATCCLGSSALAAGCGIPNLRCALPGPVMPEAYNWNNGIPFGSTSVSAMQPRTNDVQPASGTKDDGMVTVASNFWTQGTGAGTVPGASDNSMEQLSQEPTSGDMPRDFVCAPGDNSALIPSTAFYSDPYLCELINQALIGNQELRILAEEIRIANYETYARSGEYRPFVTGGVGVGIDKPGQYTRGGAVEDQLEVAPGREFPEPLPNFLVGTQISWELDIWRRLRNAQQAAALRYLGSREGRNFVVTRMVAEIAENYFQLLALDNRLATLEKTIEIQQSSLSMAEAKKVAGRGTELAVRRFEAEVEKNQAERTIIQQEIVEKENRINFLAGRFPQHIDRPSVSFVDLAFNDLCSGIPSELLQNRTDIRQAERELAAAGLDVRVARARFYPSLNLTGGLGWNAFSTGYLFQTPQSLMYGIGADLVGPLINKRAIQAAYSTANAKQLQSVYNYQQTILKAHIEVVNYLTKVENYRRSIEIKKQQLLALEASVDAANNLFQNARAEYVEVLLAQRELMEARMLLIDIKQEQLAAVINAYQALGGGWY